MYAFFFWHFLVFIFNFFDICWNFPFSLVPLSFFWYFMSKKIKHFPLKFFFFLFVFVFKCTWGDPINFVRNIYSSHSDFFSLSYWNVFLLILSLTYSFSSFRFNYRLFRENFPAPFSKIALFCPIVPYYVIWLLFFNINLRSHFSRV